MLKKRDMIRTAITMAGVGMSFAIGLTLHPPTATAQVVKFIIQAPDGGDCARLGGAWKGKTCKFGALGINQNQALTIQRGAHVFVLAQLVNAGSIGIVENGSLTLGLSQPFSAGAFVNYGSVIITPKPGLASPGLSNNFALQNFGLIFNAKNGGLSGIFNNFDKITNHGQIINKGFFHNSGPRVQARKARIENSGKGFFDNQNGRFENLGVITGRVLGNCPGDCFNRMAVTKNGKSTAKPGGKAAMSIGKQVAKNAGPSVLTRRSRQRRRR